MIGILQKKDIIRVIEREGDYAVVSSKNFSKEGYIVGNMWTTPSTTPIFECMTICVCQLVCEKLLKEGESKYRIIAFSFF